MIWDFTHEIYTWCNLPPTNMGFIQLRVNFVGCVLENGIGLMVQWDQWVFSQKSVGRTLSDFVAMKLTPTCQARCALHGYSMV